MPIYAVQIAATVTKTYHVSAPDAEKAEELAHEIFTTACHEGEEEDYSQDTIGVKEADPSVEPDGVWEPMDDDDATYYYYAAYDGASIYGVGETPAAALSKAQREVGDNHGSFEIAKVSRKLFAIIEVEGWDAKSDSFTVENGWIVDRTRRRVGDADA